MGEFASCPPQAVKAAEVICGPVKLKAITDRRGSAVWKATGPMAAVAIKLGTGAAAEVTAREASVLDQLPGYTVTAGRASEAVWFVTPWLNGQSTWDLFRAAREGAAGRPTALAGAVDLCRAVAGLHATGWVHGDLQPTHGLHTRMGVKLIDFAWSWQAGTTPWTVFEGAIVHLMAPELAAWIAAGPQPVKTTRAAEVYALAGVLWTCATGGWPLDYRAAGIDRKEAGAEGLRDAIATGKLPLSLATPWPELQDVLRPVLLSGPADRPTASELAVALVAVSR
ncbi:protein kinase domain-containing protein [Kitasatospora azatica]|uniref:protein kinase domain-containing protein n=1 Tax=Kitasatospora azatica TaxID=58347 RepID=UPI00055C7151|nr:serine/threonine-protein kinase [Kitasatospora azatica]